MRRTSILAFRSLNNINERQRQVYNALEEICPASNRQVSEQSHLPINTVTPRMGELVEAGRVVEAYRDRDDKTGRTVIFWKPFNDNVMLFEDVG